MAIAPATVVMRTTRARLRGRRLPFDRLRCCDNAVLPSAMRARRNAGRGPLRYRPASRMTARHIGRKLLRVLEQNPSTYGSIAVAGPRCQNGGSGPSTSAEKVVLRTCDLCRAHHSLAISIVSITGCSVLIL